MCSRCHSNRFCDAAMRANCDLELEVDTSKLRTACRLQITSPARSRYDISCFILLIIPFPFHEKGGLHKNKLQFKMTYVVCFEGEIVEGESKSETETGLVHGLPYLFAYIFPSRVLIAHRKKCMMNFPSRKRDRAEHLYVRERAKASRMRGDGSFFFRKKQRNSGKRRGRGRSFENIPSGLCTYRLALRRNFCPSSCSPPFAL